MDPRQGQFDIIIEELTTPVGQRAPGQAPWPQPRLVENRSTTQWKLPPRAYSPAPAFTRQAATPIRR